MSVVSIFFLSFSFSILVIISVRTPPLISFRLRRPDNWMQMAEYFSEHGISNALVQYQAELGECFVLCCVVVFCGLFALHMVFILLSLQ